MEPTQPPSSPSDPASLLTQAVDALRAGDKARARDLLGQAIRLNPADDRAWLWLSGAVETDDERRRCLERALQLNPRNEAARRGLAALAAETATLSGTPASAGSSGPRPAAPGGTPASTGPSGPTPATPGRLAA